jgi:hypothetical protein
MLFHFLTAAPKESWVVPVQAKPDIICVERCSLRPIDSSLGVHVYLVRGLPAGWVVTGVLACLANRQCANLYLFSDQW